MNRQIQVVFSRQYVPEISVVDSVMMQVANCEPTHCFTVPSNVYTLLCNGSAGGAAGELPNLATKTAGSGGAAGQVVKRFVDVQPGQRLEIHIGSGGALVDPNGKQELTSMQLQQKIYDCKDATDTVVVDCKEKRIIFVAKGSIGFSGGRSRPMEQHAESGIAAFHNAGSGFCNADGRWIGYGGGGGGGKHGGAGGCVFSNCKSTRASDATIHTGCGGGGAAFVNQNTKHFLPGAGADGYLHILYEQ